MQSGILKLSWVDIKSALVTALITAILAGAAYVIGVGDVFAIDVHALINVVALSVLTAVVSIIQSLLTTAKGKFVGAINLKEVKK